MRYLLAKSERGALAAQAAARVVLAFDFDGTLAPITHTHHAAAMRERTRSELERLARRYPCVVISGRKRADVASRVRGIPLAAIVGNHGIEPSADMKRYLALTRSFRRRLARMLAGEPGIEIEDKGYSLSIHYRAARSERGAERAIEEAIRKLGREAQAVAGKRVVNVVPRGAPHKGTALLALCRRLGARCAIYVGDDVTDEDVFREHGREGHLLGVRIGKSEDTRAVYYLKTQREIDALLARLSALRPEPARENRELSRPSRRTARAHRGKSSAASARARRRRPARSS